MQHEDEEEAGVSHNAWFLVKQRRERGLSATFVDNPTVLASGYLDSCCKEEKSNFIQSEF